MRPVVTVQPRVCGERKAVFIRVANTCGSAPRVRGTPICQPCQLVRCRFSPACAGNAGGWRVSYCAISVQPRVCGERKDHPMQSAQEIGSAPRVRGTRAILLQPFEVTRFSPACAGNAYCANITRLTTAVQPRVCGERLYYITIALKIIGSAPRVRGTRVSRKYK